MVDHRWVHPVAGDATAFARASLPKIPGKPRTASRPETGPASLTLWQLILALVRRALG